MRSRATVLAAFACISITAPAAVYAAEVGTLSPIDRENLVNTAAKLREAILRVDLRTVAKLLGSTDGLTCTDTQYKKAQIQKYLSDANSVLYQGLFDKARFSRRCGAGYPRQYPATSEKALFEANPSGTIEVEPLPGNYAEVKFVSSKNDYYPREYTFKKEGANWMLINGLVVGSCTCG